MADVTTTSHLDDPLMALFREHRVVNWHEHVWFGADGKLNERLCDDLAETAKNTGMDMVVISLPIPGLIAPADRVSMCNRTCAEALRRHPDRFRGYAYINPGYPREALAEIDRCVDEFSMIGCKFYNQYVIDEPVFYPIIERCIERGLPLLMHAGRLTVDRGSQPRISEGQHFAAAAARFPEAVFQMAHIGGGGEWEWQLRAVADSPNVYADISGSVYDAGMIERAYALLGAERLLFATDGSISPGIGKLLGADIPTTAKVTILNNPTFSRFLEGR